jgi:glucose/arabinose dehydrogenase
MTGFTKKHYLWLSAFAVLFTVTLAVLTSPLGDLPVNRSMSIEAATIEFVDGLKSSLILLLAFILLFNTNDQSKNRITKVIFFVFVYSVVGIYLGAQTNQALVEKSVEDVRLSNTYSIGISEIDLPNFSVGLKEPLPFVANFENDRVLIATSSNFGWINSPDDIGNEGLESNISLLDVSKKPIYEESYNLPGLKAIRGITYDPEKSAIYLSAITKEKNCISLSLYKYETENSDLVLHSEKKLFQSSPCLSGRLALQNSGGRLSQYKDGSILLSIGDFGLGSSLIGEWVGRPDDERVKELAEGDYGKTFLVNDQGLAQEVARGHRNPQGITQDEDGNVWISEHGPKGGDELNLLQENADYGWPIKTYGAPYSPDILTGIWDVGHKWMSDQAGFNKPVFSWFPSIAPSQLVYYRGKEFSAWNGNLIMGTLKDESLRRLYLQDGRVAYDERIHIGSRIRDMTVLKKSGKILASTDGKRLILLSRTESITK